MSRGNYRTINTPKGFLSEPAGRAMKWDSIYIGKVKETKDARRMGRLKVWIQELCADTTIDAEDKSENWIIVSYASPMGGASNVGENSNENTFGGTQKSYGFWGVPPDKNVQVAIFFANGDPGRGFWFSSVFDEQMNSMLPGIGGDGDYRTPGSVINKAEYNRAATTSTAANPVRDSYRPLSDAITRQGLGNDTLRGAGLSSARRDEFDESGNITDEPAKVTGILTPGGHQFVLDDGFRNDNGGTENSLIRFRTKNGSQILIDDNEGFVYFITRSGLTWLEITDKDGGNVDIYSAQNISVHAEKGDVNIKAGNDVMIDAGQSVYINAGEDIIMAAADSVQTLSAGKTTIQSQSDLSLTTGATMFQQAGEDLNALSGGSIKQSASGSFNIGASGDVIIGGADIHLNGPSPDGADGAADSDALILPRRVPLAEPWDQHTHNFNTPSKITSDTYPSDYRGGNEQAKRINRPADGNLIEPAGSPPGEPYDGELPSTIRGLTEAETRAYLGVLGKRESAGKYTTVNSYNFLGKYQFGTQALEDIGYVKAGSNKAQGGAGGYQSALDDPSNWTGKNGATSREAYLQSAVAQEGAIIAFTNKNYQYVSSGSGKVPLNSLSSVEIGGYLMAAHLKGNTGAKALYRGEVRRDAYGSSTEEYYKLGAGAVNNA